MSYYYCPIGKERFFLSVYLLYAIKIKMSKLNYYIGKNWTINNFLFLNIYKSNKHTTIVFIALT